MNRAFLLACFLLLPGVVRAILVSLCPSSTTFAALRSQALCFLLLLILPLNRPLWAQQGAQGGCTQNCGSGTIDPKPRNQEGGPDQSAPAPPYSPTLHSPTSPRYENDESQAMMVHMNQIQLQKDSKALGELCDSISAEMNAVQRGALPKDAVENLKSVEKLSKRVREELTRYPQANQPPLVDDSHEQRRK